MLRRTVLHLLLLPAPFVASGAGADAVLTGQSRSVHADSATIGYLWDEQSNPVFPDFDPPSSTQTFPLADDASAPGFDPFDDTAATQDPSIVITPLGSASGSQTSTLSPTSITAEGSYVADSDAYFMSAGEIATANSVLMPPVPFDFGIAADDESGSSSFSVDFDVSEPTPFHLAGSVEVSAGSLFLFAPDTTGSVSIALETSGGGTVASVTLEQVCDFASCTPAASDTLDASGVLAPGSYTLTAEATGSARSFCADVDVGFTCSEPVSDGSFDLALTLGGGPPRVPVVPPAGLVLLAAAIGVLARGRERG